MLFPISKSLVSNSMIVFKKAAKENPEKIFKPSE